MRWMTRFGTTALAAVIAAVVAAGAMGASDQAASAATGGVSMKAFRFVPATITVKVGEQVRWVNDEDTVPHDATWESPGMVSSKTLRPGDSFLSAPFTAEGSYPYFCIIHPGMRGVVNVDEATGAPSAPFAALAPAPYSARLQGAQEAPPVTTTANGVFSATPGTASVAWAAQAYGLGITAAHIHSGATGTNGPIVASLFGPDAGGQNQLNISGTITGADLVGPMAGNFAEFSRALAAGQLYVNFHTATNPGGEVRAQIVRAPGAPATGDSQLTNARTNSPWLVAMVAVVIVAGGGGLMLRAKARPRR